MAAGAALRSLGGFSLGKVSLPPRFDSHAESLLLDRNENAYGPSEKVLAVMREACSGGGRYPRSEYDLLLNKIAAFHAVKAEQIVLGCGSSEILRLAAVLFLGFGKKLVQASPTFPVLGRFARKTGVEVGDVALNKMYQHDLDAMLTRANASAGLVYICNPNNPTGTLTPRKDIENFLRKLPVKTIVLIDEAYHHYVAGTSSYVSFLDHPIDDPRVIVSRTFSNIYGLAGMRIGYAVTSQEIARNLSANRMQFCVSAVSAKAAAAALDDIEYVRICAKRNADDRQEFMNQVNARMLRALDSHTNFVMMNPMRPPEEAIEHLGKNNVFIGPRYLAMDKYIRVSLGTPAEMREFWHIWDLMPAPSKMAM
jgi:histidinol-phosphate aminotransferase